MPLEEPPRQLPLVAYRAMGTSHVYPVREGIYQARFVMPISPLWGRLLHLQANRPPRLTPQVPGGPTLTPAHFSPPQAVGFQPASEHQTPPDHTAVTLPHSGVPHSPAEAARERQQQQQQQHHGVLGVSAANNAAALVRELPTLESIRDSARGYVEALRHSVKDPSETAAEVAGGTVYLVDH